MLKCAACKKQFHYQCQNITTAKYSALYPTKKQWKCDSCSNITMCRGKISKKNALAGNARNVSNEEKASPGNSQTTRKIDKSLTGQINKDKRSILPKSNSMEDLSTLDFDRSSSFLDTTARSLPTTTQMNDSLVQSLRDQISTLSADLNSAHEEIITLNEENIELKLKIHELNKKITLLTKISSSITTSTPVSKIAPNSRSTQNKSKEKIVFENTESTPKPSHKSNTQMANRNDDILVPNLSTNTVEENKAITPILPANNKVKNLVEKERPKPKHLPTPKIDKPLIHILGDEGASGIARNLCVM